MGINNLLDYKNIANSPSENSCFVCKENLQLNNKLRSIQKSNESYGFYMLSATKSMESINNDEFVLDSIMENLEFQYNLINSTESLRCSKSVESNKLYEKIIKEANCTEFGLESVDNMIKNGFKKVIEFLKNAVIKLITTIANVIKAIGSFISKTLAKMTGREEKMKKALLIAPKIKDKVVYLFGCAKDKLTNMPPHTIANFLYGIAKEANNSAVLLDKKITEQKKFIDKYAAEILRRKEKIEYHADKVDKGNAISKLYHKSRVKANVNRIKAIREKNGIDKDFVGAIKSKIKEAGIKSLDVIGEGGTVEDAGKLVFTSIFGSSPKEYPYTINSIIKILPYDLMGPKAVNLCKSLTGFLTFTTSTSKNYLANLAVIEKYNKDIEDKGGPTLMSEIRRTFFTLKNKVSVGIHTLTTANKLNKNMNKTYNAIVNYMKDNGNGVVGTIVKGVDSEIKSRL